MDNQHRKISGYRELSQEQIDLMNEIKEHEAKTLKLASKVKSVLVAYDRDEAETEISTLARAHRWHAIAEIDFETGFMALVRSVTRPMPKE